MHPLAREAFDRVIVRGEEPVDAPADPDELDFDQDWDKDDERLEDEDGGAE